MTVQAPQQAFSHPALGEVGVLFVGHGTRNADGQAQFEHLFTQFAQCISPLRSQLAYLELAEPGIPEAMDRLISTQGIKSVLVVPVLLFTAGHAESDIPLAVGEALKNHDVRLLGQTASLECSQGAISLSATRFRQAVCPAECHSGCAGNICSKTTWIFIGRGSSSPTAAAKMRQFARLRQVATPVQTAITAFIYGQNPPVETALDAASVLGSELVVVQPHLLFSGMLMDQLTDQVGERQRQASTQKWVLTDPLGADRKLAELWAEIALDRLKPLISAWEQGRG
jgi:sirohydrochlorin cobaltochelatase